MVVTSQAGLCFREPNNQIYSNQCVVLKLRVACSVVLMTRVPFLAAFTGLLHFLTPVYFLSAI